MTPINDDALLDRIFEREFGGGRAGPPSLQPRSENHLSAQDDDALLDRIFEREFGSDTSADKLLGAGDMDPDSAGAAMQQARRFDIPASLFDGKPDDELSRRQLMQEQGEALRTSPAVRKWLDEQTVSSAAIAKDDLANLAKAGGALDAFKDFILRPVGQGFMNLSSSIYGGLAGAADIWAWQAESRFGRGASPQGILANWFREKSQEGAAMAQDVGTPTTYTDPLSQGIQSGVASLTTTLPVMLASAPWYVAGQTLRGVQLATAGMRTLLPLGAVTAGSSYIQAGDEGLSGPQAGLFAAQQGGVEMLTEAMPFGSLLRMMDKSSPLLRTLGKFAVGEMVGEQVATAWQDLNEWLYLHPENTFEDYLAERPDAAIQTAIATVVAGGAQAGVFSAIGRMGRDTGDKLGASAEEQKLFEQLAKLSEASKVRQRDMATFESFLESAAAGTPVENVYISAEALMQSGHAEKLAELSPAVRGQLEPAALSGGEVRIPVQEAFGRLGDVMPQLLQDLRVDPNGFSAREAAEFEKTEGKALEQRVLKVLEEQAGDADFKASRDRVAERVKAQLTDVGRFSDSVNTVKANFLAAYMGTQAATLGMTPEAFADQYAPHIVGSRQTGIEQARTAVTKDTYERRIDELFSGAEPNNEQGVRVLDRSDVLDLLGRGDYEVVLAEKHAVSDGRFNHPQFTVEDWKKVPEWLENPVAVLERKGGELTFVVDEVRDGQTIVIGVKPDIESPKDIGGTIRYHLVLTAYNKDQGRLPLEQAVEGGGLRYIDLRKSPAFNQNSGHQLPSNSGELRGSKVKVHTGADLFKYRKGKPALQQGPRGLFDPTTRTIALLEAADLSTFFHEAGHYFLDLQTDLAGRPDAPARVREDLDKLFQWFGVSGQTAEERLAQFNLMREAINAKILGEAHDAKLAAEIRKYHEQLAESFEEYLREGKAPSAELQPIFSQLRAWLKWVYKTLKDMYTTTSDPKRQLNDEVREVFDRMLATDGEIRLARVGSGMGQLFNSREEAEKFGVDWQQYHELTVTDVQAAQDELAARSIRDMKWFENAKGRMLKKLQAEGREARQAMKVRVAKELARDPTYAAIRFLRKGEVELDQPNSRQKRLLTVGSQGSTKLSLPALKEMYGDGPAAPWRYLATGKTGDVTAQDGMHPDDVAEIFGFKSGDALVRAILAAPPVSEAVEAKTDQHMIEEHAELSDPVAMQEAVTRALHGQMHAKVVATELAAIEKALAGTTQKSVDKNGRPVNVRTLPAAAKRFVTELIGRQKVGALRPSQFEAAARRAAQQADEAMRKGDLAATAQAKRNELVNVYATRAAFEARDEVKAIDRFFRKVLSGSDEKLAKSRDMDFVNAARALLGRFGYGGKTGSASQYMDVLRERDPATYAAVEPAIRAAELNAKPFAELSVDELLALRAEVDSLWHLSRRSRQMEIEGQKLDRDSAVADLRGRMEDIGLPARAPGEGSAVTPQEDRSMRFATVKAALRRVESWAEGMDGQDRGPFKRLIFGPVKAAADAYRADKVKYVKRFREAFAGIEPTLTRRLIEAPELGYVFGKESGGVALNEVLHAMLHTGNESNKRKLLLGRGWAQELEDGGLDTRQWDAFVARMQREGILTKVHYEFLQHVWDLLESMKPAAQAAHRDAYGKYFAEITAEQVVTPFGVFRGGYVPAMVDGRIVRDAELKQLIEAGQESLSFAFPATSKGFTRSRVEYNKPLLLDLRALPQHIDKVLKFTHLENPVRDVAKLIADNRVSEPLNRMDPAAINAMLRPWLTRSASQQVTTPVVGAPWANKFFNGLRNRTSMATMFANLSNTVQQITGFSLAAVKVKPRFLMSGTARYLASPRKTSQDVAERSVYMANRMRNEVSALMGEVDAILLKPSVYQRADQWAKRHQFFMQSAVDNVMGPMVWMGAFEQALDEGMTENQAVSFADGVVRQTQGSSLPEDVSRVETGPAFVRLFTQFAGYFNMQANLLGSGFQKIPKELGLGAKIGRRFYVAMLGFAIPAIVAEAIAQAFRGGPDDEDDDGWYLDDWIMSCVVFGQLKNLTAMVPGVGQFANSAIARFTPNPMDDRISVGAAVGSLESVAAVPIDLYKAAIGEVNARKTVRDVATLGTLITGLPLAPLARPAGYAAGVAAGDIAPTGGLDMARGLVSGAASPASR